MTLRHLEIFMSVYHQKSITKAAKELHISQPSVSLAIKELEEKYQTILFDRMNRQIYPTEKAHLLYNHSMQILSSLENMENEMYNDQVKSISFGCSMTLSQVFLPHFLKTLKEKYPTIDFHINVNNLKEIENQLLKNEIDELILSCEMAKTKSECEEIYLKILTKLKTLKQRSYYLDFEKHKTALLKIIKIFETTAPIISARDDCENEIKNFLEDKIEKARIKNYSEQILGWFFKAAVNDENKQLRLINITFDDFISKCLRLNGENIQVKPR